MKKTKLRKNGKSTISRLKKKAWDAFSLWIRKRDKWTCITCGKQGIGSFMHAGHYISRRFNATLFDERNVHAQCMNCNRWKYGNIGLYTLKLQEMYGENTIRELAEKSIKIHQFTEEELRGLIKKYSIT